MIPNLTKPYRFSQGEKTCLKNTNFNWDSQANCMNQLKENMHDDFDSKQSSKCCYCGLTYDETGRGEIDHIAPKELYPEFVFTEENLVKACQLCNSTSMKGALNTIDSHSDIYKDCDFNIVHPYFDNPEHHYKFKYGRKKVIIIINQHSKRAITSNTIFKLDQEPRTMARAKQRNFELSIARYHMRERIIARIRNIVNFK